MKFFRLRLDIRPLKKARHVKTFERDLEVIKFSCKELTFLQHFRGWRIYSNNLAEIEKAQNVLGGTIFWGACINIRVYDDHLVLRREITEFLETQKPKPIYDIEEIRPGSYVVQQLRVFVDNPRLATMVRLKI